MNDLRLDSTGIRFRSETFSDALHSDVFFVNTTLVIVATNILTHGLYFKCTIFHYAREQCFYIIQYADNLHMHVIDYIQV